MLNGTATSNNTVIELGLHKSKQMPVYNKCIEEREELALGNTVRAVQ